VGKSWTDEAWEEYLHWQAQDRKVLKKINKLIEDALRNGNTGLGKPEPLRGNLSGWWSRHIDEQNRLVYRLIDSAIEIRQCGGHYDDK
jgi:toxin YoeB